MKNAADIFSGVVIAALVILTAWGNAIAMLVFSAVALVAWFVVPRWRGHASFTRGLLAGTISFAVGFAVAMFLSRH